MLNDNMLSCRDQDSDLLQGSLLLRDLFKVLNYSLEDNMLNSAHRGRVQAARELSQDGMKAYQSLIMSVQLNKNMEMKWR